MKKIIRLITGFHQIHHIKYAFGIKIPFTNYGYFRWYSKRWKESPFQKLNNGKLYGVNGQEIENHYHDCTTHV